MAFGFGFGMPRIFTAPFTPAALFLGGQQGAWYDPSDYGVNGTLFQDSAGTTPVTAVQQPVGLMLDKSKGLVLVGPELVTNGDFNSGTTGWTAGNATLAVVNNALQVTGGTGGNGYAYQAITTIANKWYKLTFDTSFGTETNALCWVGTTIGGGQLATASWIAAGAKTLYFCATSTTTYFRFGQNTPITGLTLFFDNISVKELPGNHAFQTTSASRPVLSARYNLLTKTEQFDDAVWLKGSATVTTNKITLSAITNYVFEYASSFAQNTQYVGKVRIKNVDCGKIVIGFYEEGTGIFKGTLDVTSQVNTADYTEVSTSITTSASGVTALRFYICSNSGTAIGQSYFADKTDLRVSNDALGQPAYQRVNTATDYDTTGFKPYLAFDGVDDSLVTNSIDFTGTDKMTVFAGVRKLSDAATGLVVELSAGSNLNDGSFHLAVPATVNTPDIAFFSRGTVRTSALASGYTAPITNIVSGIGDISGDVATLRVNGTQAATSTADQGTGNYGNYPLYIGRRGGSSLPFNGRIYSLIVRGAATNATQLAQTEIYVGGKTGFASPIITRLPTIGVLP